MPIPTTIESLSTTAASNSPAGSEQRTLADDGLRQAYAFIKQLVVQGSDIASASTITPPSVASLFDITGTTTITTIASTNSWDGRVIYLQFDGALTLTHNGTTLILPGAANITTVAGDIAVFAQRGAGAWQCVNYLRKDGSLVPGSVGALTVTNLTATGNLQVDGNSTLGNAAGDTLTVAPNAITWSNNPTHSGNHTFSGDVSVQGNSTLGNAGTDTVTTNGNITINAPSSGTAITVNGVAGSAVAAFEGITTGSYARWSRSGTNIGDIGSGDSIVSGGTSTQFGINTRSGIDLIFGANTTRWLTLTTDGRLYGTALHNNAGAVTGTTNQYIASADNWTPTITNTTNVTSSTAFSCHYIRTGNVVGFSGLVTIDPTAGSTYTEIGLSLPIASNFTGSTAAEACGTACQATGTGIGTAGFIGADTTNDRLILGFTCSADAASRNWTFTGHYVIK